MAGAIALILVLAFLGLPIYLGAKIGARKNREGWLWGLALGWLGVIILLCLDTRGAPVSYAPASVPAVAAAPAVPAGPPSPAPQAGWYADPYDGTMLRYWDGGGWTGNLAPVGSALAAQPS
jgi:Protein of unknown function (DUF2510)